MLKQLTAVALAALGVAACSVEDASSEDLGTIQEEIVSCSVTGLEWKPFLARLAYDAAEDFGRWEFTTDLQVSGDKLVVSPSGFSLCAARGRTGCPAMTAGLEAQVGNNEIQNDKGKVIMNPMTIRSQLVNGFLAQQVNEQNQQWMDDSSESSTYSHFQSATKTGLPHSVELTNCAATIYEHNNFTGRSQCLRTGTYRKADLKIGNDQVSSIKVRGGMRVKLYEHEIYAGALVTLSADAASLPTFNDKTTSLVVAANDVNLCSARDSYKVSVLSGDWTKIRSKLVTLGYMRGNDVLDVRLDIPNNTIDVDPFNVDFVPPSQIGGTTYGVEVKSPTAETWRSTEDPSPSIFPVGSACRKKPHGGTSWFNGTVRSSGSYRYCYCT